MTDVGIYGVSVTYGDVTKRFGLPWPGLSRPSRLPRHGCATTIGITGTRRGAAAGDDKGAGCEGRSSMAMPAREKTEYQQVAHRLTNMGIHDAAVTYGDVTKRFGSSWPGLSRPSRLPSTAAR
jgi:hypothetical protein